MTGNQPIATGGAGMPPITNQASVAVRTVGRVLLAGVLLLTVVLTLLREIGWIEAAFFWIAAIALYLIVTGVQASSQG